MLRFALLLLILAAFLGGCGGDDDDSAATTSQSQAETGPTTPDDERPEPDGEEGAANPDPDAPPEEPDDRPSRDEFASNATRICAELHKQVARESAEATKGFEEGSGPEEQRRLVAEVIEARVKTIRAALERLEEVPRPPAAEDFEEYLRRARRHVELLERQAEVAVESEPGSTAGLTEEAARNAAALQRVAKRAGLGPCGVL